MKVTKHSNITSTGRDNGTNRIQTVNRTRGLIPSLLTLLLVGLGTNCALGATAGGPARVEVVTALKKSADWQLANPSGIDTRFWTIAPLYDGLIRLALTTGDAKYLAAVLSLGTQSAWMPGDRTYHADDHAVGHAWLDIYLMSTNRIERSGPVRERLNDIIARPIIETVRFGRNPRTPGVAITDR